MREKIDLDLSFIQLTEVELGRSVNSLLLQSKPKVWKNITTVSYGKDESEHKCSKELSARLGIENFEVAIDFQKILNLLKQKNDHFLIAVEPSTFLGQKTPKFSFMIHELLLILKKQKAAFSIAIDAMKATPTQRLYLFKENLIDHATEPVPYEIHLTAILARIRSELNQN